MELFKGSTWEYAYGDGVISKVLHKQFSSVSSTDIIDRGYERFDGIYDFIKDDSLQRTENIITNPPFKHAEEFIRRSKKNAPIVK